jgi:putative nucleotidyltransferase with HDIG domain
MEQIQRIVGLGKAIPESYLDMITSMVYALEAKDQYTSGHSRRVAAIAAAIAKELGLPEHMVDKIAVTGLIHDIGKIGVRESVLYKQGKLTDDEYQHLISHCEIGERILHPVIKDEEILDMVRHHHERYDGRGYPDGLSGKDIPLADRVSMIGDIYSQIESCLAKKEILSKNASILAVADAYDAMLSPRSYRAALSAEAAAKEVQEGAGSQFDPEVAAALLRITNSLAPLFQEERARTGKEAERLAKERNKREAEEAKKAGEDEKQAKKEAERLAKERNKREAEEAKRASKAEKEAKKEAERLAKERNKREAEEAKRASKVEIEARKEAEPLAEVKAIIEAREAERAGEVEQETKKEVEHDGGAKIYEGNVLLVVPPPVVFEQARQFKEHLERVENLRILFFGASADEGFIIAVSVQKPETLIRTINEMSMVEKAIKKSDKQIVLKLKDSAVCNN